MNQVQTFGFGLLDLRVIERDGQPWFVANDVLYALGLPLNSHGKSIHSLGPDQRSLYQIQKGGTKPKRYQRIWPLQAGHA